MADGSRLSAISKETMWLLSFALLPQVPLADGNRPLMADG